MVDFKGAGGRNFKSIASLLSLGEDDGYSTTSHEGRSDGSMADDASAAASFPSAAAASYSARSASPDFSEGSHERPSREGSPDFSVGSREYQAHYDHGSRSASPSPPSSPHDRSRTPRSPVGSGGADSPSQWSMASQGSRSPSPDASAAGSAAAASATASVGSASPPASPTSQLSAASFPSVLQHAIDAHVPDGKATYVERGETVPYTESTTKGRGKKGDLLTGDHGPSAAALKAYAVEHGDPRSAGQINSQALTNVITDSDHKRFSRTYGGRNTPAQIKKDSKDLGKALYRDGAYFGHGMSAAGELTTPMVASMASLYQASAGPQNPLPAAERPPINRQTNAMLTHYLKKAEKAEAASAAGASGSGSGAGAAAAASAGHSDDDL